MEPVHPAWSTAGAAPARELGPTGAAAAAGGVSKGQPWPRPGAAPPAKHRRVVREPTPVPEPTDLGEEEEESEEEGVEEAMAEDAEERELRRRLVAGRREAAAWWASPSPDRDHRHKKAG